MRKKTYVTPFTVVTNNPNPSSDAVLLEAWRYCTDEIIHRELVEEIENLQHLRLAIGFIPSRKQYQIDITRLAIAASEKRVSSLTRLIELRDVHI